MIPISEIFVSLEGEGPYVGQPTLFVRTWGCNFTCSGFSNPDNQVIEFVKGDQQKRHVKGCDTAYAWNKAYAADLQRFSAVDLSAKVQAMASELPTLVTLSLTGGEPMLHQDELAVFLQDLLLDVVNPQFYQVLIETNCSIELKPALAVVLSELMDNSIKVVFSGSPKLSNSGEKREDAIRPSVLDSFTSSGAGLYLKFVSNGSDASVEEVDRTMDYYFEQCLHPEDRLVDVFLMPEASTPEQLNSVGPLVAAQCIKHGYFYSTRLHISLWDNKAGT